LEHCAKLGLKGVNLGVFPSGKAYPSPADDRFWAAAVDMKMPLTVHVGFDRLGPRASQPTFEYPGADPAILAKLGPRQLVEWVAVELRHHMGVDRIMFATDFPHIECDWPNTRPFAERLFTGVPADEAFKIAAGNMLGYFHLQETPMGQQVLAAPKVNT